MTNPYTAQPKADAASAALGEALGGDVMAYRVARRLLREGITDLDALRREYDVPVWAADLPKGHMLLDLDRLGPVALERIAARLEADQAGTAHAHGAAGRRSDAVILCGTVPTAEGVRWYHLPVQVHYWHHCRAEDRDALRARVRKQLGDSSAAVEVIEPPAAA